jgi:hypothetical protein
MVTRTDTPPPTRTRRAPLHYFAAAGALVALLEVYLLVKWVAGAQFQEVHYGPTEPPGWMKASIHIAEAGFLIVGAIVVYKFVIAPWRREKRIGFDGLLVLSGIACSVFDPASSYLHQWFAYNSYFVNRGTPMTGLPGWQGASDPGSTLAWPMIFLPPLYAALFLGIAALCCAIMRRAKARFPGLNWIGLAAIAFGTVFVLDLIVEGQILMRLGFYEESGWSFSWLDSTYSHNPLRNIVLFSFVFTGAALLRYYKNDRGETLVERGASKVGGSAAKVTAMRFFAVLAATMACLTLGYHIPMTITTVLNPNAEWHPGMTQNSFLNNHVCGVGTTITCPRG